MTAASGRLSAPLPPPRPHPSPPWRPPERDAASENVPTPEEDPPSVHDVTLDGEVPAVALGAVDPPPPPPPPAPLPPEPTPLGIPRRTAAARARAQLLDLALFVVLGMVLFLPGLALLANDETVIGVVLSAVAMAIVITISIRRNRITDD